MRSFFFYQIWLFLFISMSITWQSCAQNPPISMQPENKKTTNDTFEINKSETEWKQQLSPEQYYILREKGTERSFTGKFLMHKEKGNYTCAACGNVLFDNNGKFDSHCGWPSFDREIAAGRIKTAADNTMGMRRTEIMCARCGGHLGHVFDDGPTDTGLRYCVNSLSLGFEPADSTTAIATDKIKDDNKNETEQITLAGGCFWCIEAVFQQLKGVEKVASGYMGGKLKNPTYKEVCSGRTGHAEVVQITFKPSEINVLELLQVFFTVHDPTTLNRQGGDQGTQYRSAIFYHNEAQKKISEDIIKELNESKVYDSPIVTQVVPSEPFYIAEEYHQNYYNDNPNQSYCAMVIQPKVAKFEKIFEDKLKK